MTNLRKKLTSKHYKRLACPILKKMGVDTKVNYKFGTDKTLKIPKGHSGWTYYQKGKKPTILIATNRDPSEVLRTIAHETKHATDKKAQQRYVGKKKAEKIAIAFENKFIKRFLKD